MVRAVVLGLWVYYLIYSVVAPPIVTDAHLYDLARLYVIRQGGLLHNDAFAHFTQLSFPWTFDAIHWPFVRLGLGYALPSFACFTGMLVVTFLVVRDAWDDDVAWVALLTLFALPTLVYQATSFKSDVGVLFGVLCWFHAMRRFRRDGRPRHLAWSALALAFAGGAKTSGLPVMAVLGAASLWMLRTQPRMAVVWLGYLLPAGLLFGSVETYVANTRVFGGIIGPSEVHTLRNGDGLAGAAANAIRHLAYNIDLGTDVLAGRKWLLSSALERWCRALLTAVGLRNRGCVGWFSDAELDFLKSGHEAQDGFGPIGTIAILAVPLILVTRRPADLAWRLALAAVGAFAFSAYTIGFALWVNRFLMLPFALGALAVVLYAAPAWKRSAAVRVGGLAVLVYAAVVLPAFSFSRKPIDVWRSIRDRDAMLTLEMPGNLPVLRAVRASIAACPAATWIVTPHQRAAQFLFYDVLRDREVIVRPGLLTPAFLSEVQRAHPGRAVYVLALSWELSSLPGLVEMESFAGESLDRKRTRLYRYGDGACTGAT